MLGCLGVGIGALLGPGTSGMGGAGGVGGRSAARGLATDMFCVLGPLEGPAAGGMPVVGDVFLPRMAAASFRKRCCGVICLPATVL
jgi:hypothetical protein